MSAPRILIADDEEAPREQLRAALAKVWPGAKIVAVCEHGVDAWDSYLEYEPDACFLDIRMPGLTGLDVARRIAATGMPCPVVFCTAFNDHAVAAFDAGAVDYVLKPLDQERLAQAVARVQARLALPDAGAAEKLSHTLSSLNDGTPARLLRTLQASVGREIRIIPVAEVAYFESDTRYTRVVHTDGEALIRTPLKELLAGLDTQQFWQIHRSTVVNIACLQAAVRVSDGVMHVTLKGRTEQLSVSRPFQALFKAN
jgi:DNA-binding LytR/AlgR family response regulator